MRDRARRSGCLPICLQSSPTCASSPRRSCTTRSAPPSTRRLTAAASGAHLRSAGQYLPPRLCRLALPRRTWAGLWFSVNLFAAAGGEVYRIDRHPTMAHHPATPMHEADLRLHLSQQTDLPIGLVDLRAFQAHKAAEEFRRQAGSGAAAVLLDGIDVGHASTGRRAPVGSQRECAATFHHWQLRAHRKSGRPLAQHRHDRGGASARRYCYR